MRLLALLCLAATSSRAAPSGSSAAAAAAAGRPTPPCPHGWWSPTGVTCDQACPSEKQARNSSTGRCLCGRKPPNDACLTGGVCAADGQCTTPSHGQQESTIGPVNPDYEYASAAAVERWNDLKFGLRIHWGLYAIQGIGQESWPLFANKPASDEAPTIYWMNKLCGPTAAANGTGCQAYEKWYYAQAAAWDPKKYDATMWIALMKRAGVKYFDFTAKHCEGFAMYDTATLMHDCWDWDLTGQKPPGIKACNKPYHYSSMEAFGRDIVGELITAARAGGIQPGLYFSHAVRWHRSGRHWFALNCLRLRVNPPAHYMYLSCSDRLGCEMTTL